MISKLLIWLRLVDKHDVVLSLTHLGIWICLGKVALSPQPTIADLTALLALLLAKQHTKHLQTAKEALQSTNDTRPLPP